MSTVEGHGSMACMLMLTSAVIYLNAHPIAPVLLCRT